MESLPLTFLLKKYVSILLLPPTLPLLCSAIGLLLVRRRPRIGLTLAWGGLLLTWCLSTPAFVRLLTTPLENVPVLSAEKLMRGEAIVILGAGAHRHMPEYGRSGPTRLALERLRYGARLARHSGLPVLLSGEVGPMADVLENDFSIAPRWRESGSLDTADNARRSAAILVKAGVRRIVLVTHAAHMRRALGEFGMHGIEVIPAPTAFLSMRERDDTDLEYVDYLPGPSAAFTAWYALHEWLGLAALELRRLVR